jgi:hypothetical protein
MIRFLIYLCAFDYLFRRFPLLGVCAGIFVYFLIITLLLS